MCLQGSGPALETFYKTRSEIMWFHVEAICTAGPPSQRPWRDTYRRYRIACPSLRSATVASGPSVCVKAFRIGGTMHPLLTRQLEPSSASNAIRAPSSLQCKSHAGVRGSRLYLCASKSIVKRHCFSTRSAWLANSLVIDRQSLW